MQAERTPNRLAQASSPYLLQHAYNPVDWREWNAETLEEARASDKPIIVSVGYSACHWCHVMERESFESERVAELMNRFFVCVKVDREERPDVDQIYMEAVQLMGIQGGWPLNVFLTPEAKPFYGGTYFPPEHWTNLLLQIGNAFSHQENRGKLVASAEQFAEALRASELERAAAEAKTVAIDRQRLDALFRRMQDSFDSENGGRKGRPKFPMPVIYRFLLRYHRLTDSREALAHLTRTLDAMADGGIYDQIGGGFARYSVDAEWFAPHFEKMLYDNAQLLTLYAETFRLTRKQYYREIVHETVNFLERELLHESGGFFSALDADSEGVEGKFYTWQEEEIDALLEAEDAQLFKEFFDLEPKGNWEDGVNILYRPVPEARFAKRQGIAEHVFHQQVHQWKERLLEARNQRIRPGLDDKILAGWNGLTLAGLADAYVACEDEAFLRLAIRNAEFLDREMTDGDRLFRSWKNGKASLYAYLEDYAAVIDGYASLYQACFDEKWLRKAEKLADYAINRFWDEAEGLFFYTDSEAEALLTRKKELFDNVIPSSNSMMARNLHVLGAMLDRADFKDLSGRILAAISPLYAREANFLSGYALAELQRVEPTAEVAIVGPEYQQFAKEFRRRYLPNTVLLATERKSALPLLKGRSAIKGKTTVYVCYGKSCKLPVHSVEEAVEQVRPTRPVIE